MPQFDVSSFSAQLIWLFIVFGILYYIILKLIAPRVESILTTRNSYIEDNISYAQGCNDKIKSLQDLQELQLDQIHSQVEDLQKHSMDALNVEFEKNQLELSQIINKEREKALVVIENYVDQFHDDSKQYCIKIADLIIKKITNKESDIALLEKIYGEK